MRKRFAAISLCVSALLACACAHTEAPPAAGNAAVSAQESIAAAPVIEAAAPALAVTPPPASTAAPTPFARQYGEETTLVADGNGFSGTLKFPQGGVQPVNRAIADWANAEFAALESRAAGEPADADGMRATAAIDYDAYLYGGRFVGIKLIGAYRAVVSGETSPVLFTYNYDLDASKRVTLSDVIAPEQTDAVRSLVAERLGWLDAAALSEAGTLSAAAMQDFVMRDDGIEWLFTSGGGVTGVLLDYAALAPYLSFDEPESAAPLSAIVAEGASIGQTATCLYDGVQARTLPSASAGEPLGTVEAGETLGVLKPYAVRGWHEVDYGGRIAYVDASLVRLDSEDAAVATGWVTSTYLHVRARASVSGALLGTMVFQEPVRIVDSAPIDGWYKIWFEGKIAYVNARYVSTALYPPEEQAVQGGARAPEPADTPHILRQTLAPIVGLGVCMTDGAIVRSAPNGKASAFGTLARDEQVYIMEEECAAGWDRIFVYTEANSGYIGYVQARYVRSFVPDA